jgi:hypothetical protein
MKMKNLVKIVAFGMFALLVSKASALTLTVGDAYYLGYINDGIPSNPASEAVYISTLTTLTAGQGVTTIGTEDYDRLLSTLSGPFAPVSATPAFKNEDEINSLNLSGGGWQYVLAKYNARSAGSLVWYLENGSPDEVIVVPATINGKGVSHVSAYNYVPDGGFTLMLLGLGIGGLALLRRKLT